jgi:hypothetical protein
MEKDIHSLVGLFREAGLRLDDIDGFGKVIHWAISKGVLPAGEAIDLESYFYKRIGGNDRQRILNSIRQEK